MWKVLGMAAIGIDFIWSIAVMYFVLSLIWPGNVIPWAVAGFIWLAFGYYFCVLLMTRPIRLSCRKCKKVVSSKTPWVCGICKHVNMDVSEFPFLNKCANPACGMEPKAYRCHHCDEKGKEVMIFLSPDQDKEHYAFRFVAPLIPAAQPEPTEHEEQLKQMQERRELQEAKLEVVRFEAEIAEIRKKIRSDVGNAKTGAEIFLLQAEAKRQIRTDGDLAKEAATKKYKDNRRAIKEVHLLIDEAVHKAENEF